MDCYILMDSHCELWHKNIWIQDQPNDGSEMKTLTSDQGYDNVLHFQGYCMPHAVVIGE